MIQDFVTRRDSDHTYSDKNGNSYESVSRVLSALEEPFDAIVMSKRCAGKGKYAGLTADQVLEMWNKKRDASCDHGTRIHGALENYSKNFSIKPEDEEIAPIIQSVSEEFKDYDRAFDEAILYHPKYMVAGTTDRALKVKARSKQMDITDFKTNEDIGFYNDYGKYYFAPVSHLQVCKYNRYSLQLSIYALMIEAITSYTIRRLFIKFIPKDNPMAHRIIPVNYMKRDAEAILEHHYNKRLSAISPMPQFAQQYENYLPDPNQIRA